MDNNTLWAVHVEGPDDILAAADEAAAVAQAAEINSMAQMLRDRPDASPNDPHLSAKVIPWDGTAEEHAKYLAELLADGGYNP